MRAGIARFNSVALCHRQEASGTRRHSSESGNPAQVEATADHKPTLRQLAWMMTTIKLPLLYNLLDSRVRGNDGGGSPHLAMTDERNHK
jgi:hypothetical protein